jgi:hypothetical protein
MRLENRENSRRSRFPALLGLGLLGLGFETPGQANLLPRGGGLVAAMVGLGLAE